MTFRFESSVVFCSSLLALVLVLFGGISVHAQCNPVETHQLLPSPNVDRDFGEWVGVSGTKAIAGAHSIASVFSTTTGQLIVELVPDDGDEAQVVAISGNIAITANYNAGSNNAHVFDASTGVQIHTLTPNDSPSGAGFGNTLAIDGNIAIVGARSDDDNGDNSGSAYLFDVSSGQQLFKLLPDDGTLEDFFGRDVAISGNTAIVGAVGDDDNGDLSGSAYLFDVATGQQIAKLLPDDGAAGDWFGRTVAISGNTAICGARNDDDNGEDSGAAYLFDTVAGQQIAKLLPDDGAAGDNFGEEVAIDGNFVLVGAPGDDDAGEDSGSIYLFDTMTGQQVGKFRPNDNAAIDRIGRALAINETNLIAGDREGGAGFEEAAYLFDISSCAIAGVVNADSYLVTRGTYVSGGVVELADSDNADLSIQRAVADIQSRTEFEVKAVSPVANPSSLEVTLEGSVFARSQVNQTIELFDYAAGPAGQWEQVDTRPATRFTDSTVTVAATGDLSRFVEPGTMCIEARIRYQSLVARQQFSSNIDQFIWTIGQ